MSNEYFYLNEKKTAYDYFCQDNVCRLCWKISTNFISLGDAAVTRKIQMYIGINTKSQPIQTVCVTCLNKIDSFVSFRKFCHEMDKRFNNIMSKSKKYSKFENHYCNPIILKTDVDSELNLLVDEITKDNDDSLFIKDENELVDINDSPMADDNDDDFLPKDDGYCYFCNQDFGSVEVKTKHDNEVHKIKDPLSYNCYHCKNKFKKLSQKICHELLCPVSSQNKTCSKILENNKKFSFMTEPAYQDKTEDDEYNLFMKILKQRSCEQKTPAFECKTCMKKFASRLHLKKHKITHRTTEKKYICEVCGKVLKGQFSLTQHMYLHTSYKQLKCPHCDYRATLQCSLDVHLRCHTGERPYACDRCSLRCVNASNLKKHMNTHLATKDYTCDTCNRKYSYKSSLADHIAAKHLNIKQHVCKICNSQYYSFKSLRDHILVKHGKRVHKVKDDFVELDNETYEKKMRSKLLPKSVSREPGVCES